MASISVLYPKESQFDMPYYLSTHMPLVQKLWSSYGLTGWKVISLNSDEPYSVHAILSWKDEQSYQNALQSEETKEILGDVKNFSDQGPTFLKGKVVGSS